MLLYNILILLYNIYLEFKFTPTIPPIIPSNMLNIIVVMTPDVKAKFPEIKLPIVYTSRIYINPTNPPFFIPFSFIFIETNELAINTLSKLKINTQVGIELSGISVYANKND